MANAQTWIFLKNFKCKGMFSSFAFDPLLSCESRDFFHWLCNPIRSGVMYGVPFVKILYLTDSAQKLLSLRRDS